MIDLRALLDRPIAYHRIFVDVAGSVPGAVFLSQLLYWSNRTRQDREGWFWKTNGEWADETGLTRKQIEAARNRLSEAGVVEVKVDGFPARTWYRLDAAQLEKTLSAALAGKPDKNLFDAAAEASLSDSANSGLSDGANREEAEEICGLQPDCTIEQTGSLSESANRQFVRSNAQFVRSDTEFVPKVQTDLTEITTEITSQETTPPAACDAESVDQSPTTPEASEQEPFPMHIHWQPRPQFADRCAMSGISLAGIPWGIRQTLFGEFMSYWETRPDELTQAGWEHKLLQRLIDKNNRGELSPPEGAASTSLRSRPIGEALNDRSWFAGEPKPRGTRSTSLSEDLNDRSWA